MNRAGIALFVFCMASASIVIAQTAIPKMPESTMKMPADPGGMRKPKDDAVKTPSDPGSIVVPPSTGTEEIAKQPRNVDSGIDDATTDIDRKNRKKSREKSQRKPQGKSEEKPARDKAQ